MHLESWIYQSFKPTLFIPFKPLKKNLCSHQSFLFFFDLLLFFLFFFLFFFQMADNSKRKRKSFCSFEDFVDPSCCTSQWESISVSFLFPFAVVCIFVAGCHRKYHENLFTQCKGRRGFSCQECLVRMSR